MTISFVVCQQYEYYPSFVFFIIEVRILISSIQSSFIEQNCFSLMYSVFIIIDMTISFVVCQQYEYYPSFVFFIIEVRILISSIQSSFIEQNCFSLMYSVLYNSSSQYSVSDASLSAIFIFDRKSARL